MLLVTRTKSAIDFALHKPLKSRDVKKQSLNIVYPLLALAAPALIVVVLSKMEFITEAMLLGIFSFLIGFFVLVPFASKKERFSDEATSSSRKIIEERRDAALRALKDLEFEHSCEKIDDADLEALSKNYRVQAKDAIVALEALDKIEKDLAPVLSEKRTEYKKILGDLEEGTTLKSFALPTIMFSFLAQEAGAGAEPASPVFTVLKFVVFVAICVFFIFTTLRGKRSRLRQATIESAAKGDRDELLHRLALLRIRRDEGAITEEEYFQAARVIETALIKEYVKDETSKPEELKKSQHASIDVDPDLSVCGSCGVRAARATSPGLTVVGIFSLIFGMIPALIAIDGSLRLLFFFLGGGGLVCARIVDRKLAGGKDAHCESCGRGTVFVSDEYKDFRDTASVFSVVAAMGLLFCLVAPSALALLGYGEELQGNSFVFGFAVSSVLFSALLMTSRRLAAERSIFTLESNRATLLISMFILSLSGCVSAYKGLTLAAA
ncbi:MAG: hypothetical protein NUW37_09920 [Planctomycetes bacterium]|nr:hypothetical protein [Planctomycetota bacterium]